MRAHCNARCKNRTQKVYTRVLALSFAAVALLAINNAASRGNGGRGGARDNGKKKKNRRKKRWKEETPEKEDEEPMRGTGADRELYLEGSKIADEGEARIIPAIELCEATRCSSEMKRVRVSGLAPAWTCKRYTTLQWPSEFTLFAGKPRTVSASSNV